ncbi:hypothetical protein BDQ94DRAFT_166717 [Aspergillus welwitschiae]|uniref:Uncharacterized protein n=1 Tax=Aspergillus welwitschiae TaxID=1341132 RepID=A0A3F3QEG3_9EURO|nr:hypothetical protein BDQ94DRAFT_166717 [Aspergillus welwitschiae]RDH37527.1 hypothetical protein BDQ94DRAFT_166717 [Aspergillus welwitschiae]
MAWKLSKFETQEGSPSEPLLLENEIIQSSPKRNSVRNRAHIALLVAVSIVSFTIGYWIHAAPHWQTRDACRHRRPSDIEWTSKPAVIPWSSLRLNGTLYAQNKFRGEPSAQLDSEWDRFTTNGEPLKNGVRSVKKPPLVTE